MNSSKRKIELDILRGIAILLVLIRHSPIDPITYNVGWIGVDLFFVLSGYLISGLIFSEIIKTGTFDAKRFLIRRAFKIYPMFYLSLILYIVFIPEVLITDLTRIVADFILVQNYVNGWGHIYSASWSIAVEEHFYLGLVFLIWWLLKTNRTKYFKRQLSSGNAKTLDFLLIATIFMCLVLRTISTVFFSELNARNFTMTHLRIDTLLSGVWLGYRKLFLELETKQWLETNKSRLILLAATCIIWVPFMDPVGNNFAQTIGFSLTNIAFSIVVGLVGFNVITVPLNSNDKTSKMYLLLSFVGVSSYSIYLMHTLGNKAIKSLLNYYSIIPNDKLDLTILLVVSTFLNILIGYFFTDFFENKFLALRNRLFPSKVASPIKETKNI